MSALQDYVRHVRAFSPNARRFLFATSLWSLGLALLGVTRNLYFKEAGLNESEIGNILAAGQLGSVFCTIPAAMLLDRWRMKPLLLVSVLVAVAGSFGQALLPGRLAISAASFVGGAGGAIFGVASAPFFSRNSTTAERGHLFGVSVGCSALAGTLGTLAVRALEPFLGEDMRALRIMMVIGAAGALLAFAPLLFITEGAPDGRRRRFRDFLMARDWKTLGKLCGPDALIGCGAGLTIPFINLYFQGRFSTSPGTIALYFAASSAMNMIGFFLAPALAQRWGRVGLIAATQLLSIPFFAALAFSPWLTVSIAAFLLRSLLMNMASPIGSAFAMDMTADDQQAVTNSVKQLSWNLAWTFSSSAGGWMIHNVTVGRDGYTLPMLVTIGLYLCGSVLFLLFWARKPRPDRISSPAKGD